MKIIMNQNQEIVEEVQKQLDKNLKQYGKRFCPCVLPINYNNDTICMCKAFREQVDRNEPGECHCGLFIAMND